MTLTAGTKVRTTKGPLGLVDDLGAYRFVDPVAMAGATGTVVEYQSTVDGYVYVEMDEPLPDGRTAYLPTPPEWLEEVR